MLNLELVVLIHADESLDDVTRVQVIRVHEEVIRVLLLHVCVEVVDRHDAQQLKPSLFLLLMVHYLEDAVEVVLRQDSELALVDVRLPAHARENQADCLLLIDAQPLSSHHVLR